MDEFEGWEFLIQATVNSGHMINLPGSVKNAVGEEHLLEGPVVHWSIEREKRYIVLSDSPLEKATYENLGTFKIYDIESLNEDGGRIRPPKDLSSVWAADPQPGERVFYLTHRRMCRGQKSSAYLLSEDQVLDLLPGQTSENKQGRSTDFLFQVPSFQNTE